MAEKPAAEKTEQPTPKKLQKAKSKGQVPQSQEFPSVATLAVMTLVLVLSGSHFHDWFVSQMIDGLRGNTGVFADSGSFVKFVNGKIIAMSLLVCPIFGVLFAASALAGIAVSGLNFAPEAVSIRWDQLNPVTGMAKLVNSRSLVRLLLSILKLLFVSLVIWLYLRNKLAELASLRWAWSDQMLAMIGKTIIGLLIRLCIVLFVLSVADVIFQKWKHIQDLRMTRQEVKQERKDTEGSPEVKSRIRRIQYEMTMRRISVEVPKANVILVNPTHVAVALRYEASTMQAPVVVAKGADHVAEKIREVARAYGVPIVRRPELARTIYSTVKTGGVIPEGLYVAVAEILALLHRLRRSRQ